MPKEKLVEYVFVFPPFKVVDLFIAFKAKLFIISSEITHFFFTGKKVVNPAEYPI